MRIKSFFLMSCATIMFLATPLSAKYKDDRIYARAKIIKIKHENIDAKRVINLFETKIHLKVLDGEMKDQVKIAIFKGENDQPAEMRYNEGDTVFIGVANTGDTNSTEYVSIYDIDNSNSIILLVALTVLCIVLIGRIKGIASLGALIVTILLLFFILIPLTLKGHSPLPIAVLISIVSIIITLPIIAGFKLKTLAAVLGASGGIILASLLAIASGGILHLSGLVTNDMLTVFYAADVNIHLKGLVLSGMVIAALGAIMDICISIASATNELYQANPNINEKDALKSVLNIGTDILGSMVNTLILAYVGSSLSLILLIAMKIKPGMSFWMVLNYNPVLNEIVKSIIGSIGMFVCIPLTAYIAVKLYKRKYSKLNG